eukprot:scaffold89152_cov33-Prasinocladus_malaysianus.AAC.1
MIEEPFSRNHQLNKSATAGRVRLGVRSKGHWSVPSALDSREQRQAGPDSSTGTLQGCRSCAIDPFNGSYAAPLCALIERKQSISTNCIT